MNKTHIASMARRMMSPVGSRRTSEWFQMSPEEIQKAVFRISSGDV
jgi:hypothetical protein